MKNYSFCFGKMEYSNNKLIILFLMKNLNIPVDPLLNLPFYFSVGYLSDKRCIHISSIHRILKYLIYYFLFHYVTLIFETN